jgi:hypothetical protein
MLARDVNNEPGRRVDVPDKTEDTVSLVEVQKNRGWGTQAG